MPLQIPFEASDPFQTLPTINPLRPRDHFKHGVFSYLKIAARHKNKNIERLEIKSRGTLPGDHLTG